MIRTLTRTQFIPAPVETVWAYFSAPENLNALTPPWVNFKILNSPGPMREGQLIEYHIRLSPWPRMHWLTEIRHVRENRFFVDEQRNGPYRLWYHEHHFAPVEGGVEMTDHVTYIVPFEPLGSVIHALWIRPKLEHIFDWRRSAVERIFTTARHQ